MRARCKPRGFRATFVTALCAKKSHGEPSQVKFLLAWNKNKFRTITRNNATMAGIIQEKLEKQDHWHGTEYKWINDILEIEKTT